MVLSGFCGNGNTKHGLQAILLHADQLPEKYHREFRVHRFLSLNEYHAYKPSRWETGICMPANIIYRYLAEYQQQSLRKLSLISNGGCDYPEWAVLYKLHFEHLESFSFTGCIKPGCEKRFRVFLKKHMSQLVELSFDLLADQASADALEKFWNSLAASNRESPALKKLRLANILLLPAPWSTWSFVRHLNMLGLESLELINNRNSQGVLEQMVEELQNTTAEEIKSCTTHLQVAFPRVIFESRLPDEFDEEIDGLIDLVRNRQGLKDFALMTNIADPRVLAGFVVQHHRATIERVVLDSNQRILEHDTESGHVSLWMHALIRQPKLVFLGVPNNIPYIVSRFPNRDPHKPYH